MEKTIINKVYLKQFLEDFDFYDSNLGKVSKMVSTALFRLKDCTFEKAVGNSPIKYDLENLVESAWKISHDEDTIIAILEKLDCEVI